MLRAVFTAFILVFSVLAGRAQKPDEFIRLGDAAAERGSPEEAHAYYEQAYLLDSTSFDASVKYAESLRGMKYYLDASRLYAKIYDKDKGKLFPDGLYRLASMQRITGKYEDAYRNFKKYRKKVKEKKDPGRAAECDMQIASCEFALNYRKPKTQSMLQNMGPEINTDHSEIAPWLHKGSFFFSTSETGNWMIMQRPWLDSATTASAAVRLPGVEQNGSSANMAIRDSTDEHYFTRLNVGAVYTDIESSAETMTGINGDWNTTMPCPARIGGRDVLFFASDRPGGFGGYDVWYVVRENGKFSAPVNPGSTVNTPGNELTPFYSGDILYFSSDWHPGFGGYDIFSSEVKDGKFFFNPVNVGEPFNSGANDFYYTLFPQEHIGFLASNRASDPEHPETTCCNDLYSFPIVPEPDKPPAIRDLETLNKYLPVTLYFHNDEPNPDSWDTTTVLSYLDAYGSYKNLLSRYIEENCRGLKGEEREDAQGITEDFFRMKVDQGVSDLQLFCTLVEKELKAGKRLNISVRGFASPRAQTDYNVNLTRRRIASLVNFMRITQNGAFAPYIDGSAESGGRLIFTSLPFGEYQADKSVSDDLNNEKQSIYSKGACLERKIEIQSVTYLPEEPRAILESDAEVFDFGRISQKEAVTHVFHIRNAGNAILIIDSVRSECGCTVPDLSLAVLPPGEETDMTVTFDPSGKRGQQSKVVAVYLNGDKPRLFTVLAEVY